jgi:hypothetical protein
MTFRFFKLLLVVALGATLELVYHMATEFY